MTDSTKTIIEENSANTLTDMEMDEAAGGLAERAQLSGDPIRRFDAATSNDITEQMNKEMRGVQRWETIPLA